MSLFIDSPVKDAVLEMAAALLEKWRLPKPENLDDATVDYAEDGGYWVTPGQQRWVTSRIYVRECDVAHRLGQGRRAISSTRLQEIREFVAYVHPNAASATPEELEVEAAVARMMIRSLLKMVDQQTAAAELVLRTAETLKPLVDRDPEDYGMTFTITATFTRIEALAIIAAVDETEDVSKKHENTP